MANRKGTKQQTMIYKTMQKIKDWATQFPLNTLEWANVLQKGKHFLLYVVLLQLLLEMCVGSLDHLDNCKSFS
jgi:hypothetical protein